MLLRAGTGRNRAPALLTGVLLLLPGLVGCEYRDDSATGPSATSGVTPSPSAPFLVSGGASPDLEANFTVLRRLLGLAPGAVLVEDNVTIGSLDESFRKNALVNSAGAYTATAACAGAADVTLVLHQNPRTGSGPLELAVACSGTSSQVIELQAGFLSAELVHISGSPDTWAAVVAGVKFATAG